MSDLKSDLTQRKCEPCEGGVPPLSPSDAKRLLAQVPGWALSDDGKQIRRAFDFKGFMPALAFASAIGWMAEREGHHPDLEVGWGYCVVRYTTHAIGGLSDNDFICAAKVNALVPELTS